MSQTKGFGDPNCNNFMDDKDAIIKWMRQNQHFGTSTDPRKRQIFNEISEALKINLTIPEKTHSLYKFIF